MSPKWYKNLYKSRFVRRQLYLDFQGGEITSDAGLLLIQARHSDSPQYLAGCVSDNRDPRYVDHGILDLLRQRIYQIVTGCEDCNDAKLLRRDPALKAVCDRLFSEKDLVSQQTLKRLEIAATVKDLYRIGKVLCRIIHVERKKKDKPKRIILEIDTTDNSTNGNQQQTFFHGYYDQYMYHLLQLFEMAKLSIHISSYIHQINPKKSTNLIIRIRTIETLINISISTATFLYKRIPSIRAKYSQYEYPFITP